MATEYEIEKGLKALPYLVAAARARQTITYSELAEKVGSIARHAGRFLAYVRDDICVARGLPLLTVLVLNKGSELPGAGFLPEGTEDLSDEEYRARYQAACEEVYSYPGWEQLLEELGLEPISAWELLPEVQINPAKIAELVHWVQKRFNDWQNCQHPGFFAEEIGYKQQASRQAHELLGREQFADLLADGQYEEIISRLDRIGRSTNLLSLRFPSSSDLRILSDEKLDRAGFCQQIFDLLHGDEHPVSRFENYLNYVSQHGLHNKWPFPTYYLFLFQPETEIFVKPDLFRWFLSFIDAPQAYRSNPSAALYQQIRALAHGLLAGLEPYGAHDMFDVQSVIYVANGEYLAPPFDSFFTDRKEADWALDLYATICQKVCNSSDEGELAEDPRIALTLPRNRQILRLNIGTWLIASLSEDQESITLALLDSEMPRRFVRRRYRKYKGQEAIAQINLSRADVHQMPEELQTVYDASLAHLADHFRDLRGSPNRHAHQERLFKALFNAQVRQHLFCYGLKESLDDNMTESNLSEDETSMEISVPTFYRQLQKALARQGQVILYGPPGTGKSYQARRFAIWQLLQANARTKAKAQQLAEQEALRQLEENNLTAIEQQLKGQQSATRTWFMVANPTRWRWSELKERGTVDYSLGKIRKHFQNVQEGDLVIGYESQPSSSIVSIARVSKGLFRDETGTQFVQIKPVTDLQHGISYRELTEDSIMANSEPIKMSCQGRLFRLSESESEHLFGLLSDRNEGLDRQVQFSAGGSGQLIWTTFHPSYSYEDFVEGFRPVDSGESGLVLRLENGLFKQLCQVARGNPDRDYILVIDEINRANLAKVFGELITLMEKDKRGLTVTLPQSRDNFSIPANVYIIGTMNTADRSIKLMDAALRRRFAFVEMMPEPDRLQGQIIDGLNLSSFLAELNNRISGREGREKQIGHAYLMLDGQPIQERTAFAERFREEILPLLQEYCYDDYHQLQEYLGSDLIDADRQALRHSVLNSETELIKALRATFNGAMETSHIAGTDEEAPDEDHYSG